MQDVVPASRPEYPGHHASMPSWASRSWPSPLLRCPLLLALAARHAVGCPCCYRSQCCAMSMPEPCAPGRAAALWCCYTCAAAHEADSHYQPRATALADMAPILTTQSTYYRAAAYLCCPIAFLPLSRSRCPPAIAADGTAPLHELNPRSTGHRTSIQCPRS